MSNEEIKAEIVKALQSGENQQSRIFYHLTHDFGVQIGDFEKCLEELIDCDRVTDLEEGYLHLNY